MPELIVPPGLVCGIDEAGRGPLAGPVVAAAVILDPARPIAGLNDSKKLSEKKRDALAVLIRERALASGVDLATYVVNVVKDDVMDELPSPPRGAPFPGMGVRDAEKSTRGTAYTYAQLQLARAANAFVSATTAAGPFYGVNLEVF